MPRHRPGAGCPTRYRPGAGAPAPDESGPVTSTFGKTVTRSEPVGVAPRCRGPVPPLGGPANRSSDRGDDRQIIIPVPAPLSLPVASAPGPRAEPRLGRGPSPPVPTRRWFRQTRFPRPGRRCAFRYGAHHRERITPGQGVVLNSQGNPQNFLVTPRKGPFVHRSCTGLGTVASPRPAVRGRFTMRSHVPPTARSAPVRVDDPGRSRVEWSAVIPSSAAVALPGLRRAGAIIIIR